MKTYTIPGARLKSHPHPHPERTAYRNAAGHLNMDYRCQVWPNRAAMLKSIEMQESAGTVNPWRPLLTLCARCNEEAPRGQHYCATCSARNKLWDLSRGLTVTLNDAILDTLAAADLPDDEAALLDRLRTEPNPDRVGTLDQYRATLAPEATAPQAPASGQERTERNRAALAAALDDPASPARALLDQRLGDLDTAPQVPTALDDDCPALHLGVMADGPIGEIAYHLATLGEPDVDALTDGLADHVADQARAVYAANRTEAWGQNVRGEGPDCKTAASGRDFLARFMGHWAAAEMVRRRPSVIDAIPSRFKLGGEAAGAFTSDRERRRARTPATAPQDTDDTEAGPQCRLWPREPGEAVRAAPSGQLAFL